MTENVRLTTLTSTDTIHTQVPKTSMMPMTTSLIDETQLYQCSNSADRNGYNPFYSHADPVHSFTYNTMARQRLDEQVSVKLEDGDLWHRFHNLGTEMIITKYVCNTH